jgi:hypothetical protein
MNRRAAKGRDDMRQEGASPDPRTMIRDLDGIAASVNTRLPRAPAAEASAASHQAGAAAEVAAPATPGVPMFNPHMRIEAALNLVVLEFRDADGTVNRSIPSPREIDAYRASEPETVPPKAELDVEG